MLINVNESLNINNLVEDYKNEIVELASNLIKIPSENRAPDGDELAAQEFLEGWFSSAGIETDRFELSDVESLQSHEAFWPGRNYAGRPNIVAKVPGKKNGKSIIFSNHIDTVTRAPSPWDKFEPFSGEIEGDRLYGRGAYDMKGALAATAVILKIIKENNIQLSGDVYFESVVDEENAGANGTLASRIRGYNPDFSIIPEPTNLDICPHCKGGQVYEISFAGRSGVNYGRDVLSNPIYNLARVVNRIEEYEAFINEITDPPVLFADDPKPRAVVLAKVKSGDLSPGGNIGYPESAWLEMFVQTLPGFDEDDLYKEILEYLQEPLASNQAFIDYPPKIQASGRFLYPSVTDPSHPMFDLLTTNFQEITGREPKLTGASFACDGFIFSKYFNVPTALFGPVGGNAHGKDEWVSIKSLIEFTEITLAATLEFCK